ncbi:hypothetical protein F9U64_04710 [Gracilibacillus oryzae]|uniref:DUF5590 domain-containing protein n=1 Tax=Gracilibacillus oryzae TaxID=1672701 RepID=A0A7C8GVS8_9BACI|nr:hypothetical protein [Gracilibacillus oryzae]KAB8138454.1 hypothetical protein F9U64_04710 [Gracilibacillus oryzae]
MGKLFLPFIELKKSVVISWIAIILFGGVLFYFIHIYKQVMDDKVSQYDEVRQYLLEEEPTISKINTIERYHGDKLYYVADAEMEENNAFIFVTENDTDFHYNVYNKDDFYATDEILTEWQNSCSNCKLINSAIGMLNGNPALEIKYMLDKQLVYEHVLLSDKSTYTLTIDPLIN